MSNPIVDAQAHLSEAKRALLARRLKGRSDIVQRDEPAAPAALIQSPETRHQPYRAGNFIAQRIKGRDVQSGGFRMFLETRKTGLDPERYAAAWQRLYTETDAMRARVGNDGMVVVGEAGEYAIISRDIRALSKPEQAALLDGTRARFESFGRGPDDRAVEVAVIRIGDDEYACFYSFDLLVLDLSSIEFLALRCRRIYEGGEVSDRAGLHWQDYRRTEDAYLASGDGQTARRHWEKRISQAGPRLRGASLGLTGQAGRGYGYLNRVIPRDIWLAGQKLAKARGVNELVAVQVLFTDLLAHLSGETHFAYESRSFPRLPFHPDIYDLLGQFAQGHLTGADKDAPRSFVERVRAEQDRMDRSAPFGLFDAVTLWQADEPKARRGSDIVFTNACYRFEEFVLAGNVPPVRWFGDYKTIQQRSPDTALEYVLVENSGDLENHWFLNHAIISPQKAEAVYALFWAALHRLCVDNAAWDEDMLFAAAKSPEAVG